MVNQRMSEELFREAQRYLPGGVDSPVRAFRAVGGTPPFIARGKGSKIFDADGNQYIDYVCSWGPLILGHAHAQVVEALKKALAAGTSFGAPTQLETTLAKMISAAMPAVEMLRFVNSGTEAAMSALRLARAYTKRDKIIKFAGGYHGHSDGLLVKAGSGVATLGIPIPRVFPPAARVDSLTAPYNDSNAVERLFERYPKDVAAVIVEPVAANMGVVPPQPGFLQSLRSLTAQFGALLIFDEVITGFRVALGGAQAALRGDPRSDLPGEDYWRRIAGGCLRRQTRDYGNDGPAGAGLPGRDAFGKPDGDDGGDRDAQVVEPDGSLQPTGDPGGEAGKGDRGSRGQSGNRAACFTRRLLAYCLFYRQPGG